MNDSLEIIVEMIAIVSFCCGVVNYTVIKPLRTSIDTLAGEVRDFKKVLDDVDRKVDRKVDNVDRRVDGLDKQVTLNVREIKQLNSRVTQLEGYHKQPINGGKYS